MRQYTQREMSEILRIAADAEESGAPKEATYSLEEIQKVAGEVGLDSARIAFAASQLDSRRISSSKRKKTHDTFSAPIAGDLSAESWEQVVREMRAATGVIGEVRQTSTGVQEWTGSTNGDNYVVTFHRAGDQPHIYVSADRSGTDAVIWTVGGALVFVGSLITFAVFGKGGLLPGEVVAAGTVIAGLGGGLWATAYRVREMGRRRFAELTARFQKLGAQPQVQVQKVEYEEAVEEQKA